MTESFYDQHLISQIQHDWQNPVADLEPVTDEDFTRHFTPAVPTPAIVSVPWKLVPPIGKIPSPRSHHTVTLVGNQMFVLFGRNGDRVFNDFAAFDVDRNEWRVPVLNGVVPGARYGHSAVLFPNKAVVIFGGCDGERYLNDVHILDLAAEPPRWISPTTPGWRPIARAGHVAAAAGPTQLLIYGGYDGRRYRRDTMLLDLQTMQWSKVTPSVTLGRPSARGYCTGVTDSVENKLVIYGGRGNTSMFSELYILPCATPASWCTGPTTGLTAPQRSGHATVMVNGQLLVFGGCGEDSLHSGGFVIDGASMRCSALRNPLPSSVAHHGMCVAGDRLLCFGGCIETGGCLGSVYALETKLAMLQADSFIDVTTNIPLYLELPAAAPPGSPYRVSRTTTVIPTPGFGVQQSAARAEAATASLAVRAISPPRHMSPPRQASPPRSPGSKPRLDPTAAQRFILFNLPDVTRDLRAEQHHESS